MRICKVEGCFTNHHAKGYCQRHCNREHYLRNSERLNADRRERYRLESEEHARQRGSLRWNPSGRITHENLQN